MAAVQQKGFALTYASRKLKNDVDFIVQILLKNPKRISLDLSPKRLISYGTDPQVIGMVRKKIRAKIERIKRRNKINKLNNQPRHKKRDIKYGGSQFIHIPNHGKRKVRYQKNGRAYVIVNKKKLKLN